MSAYLNSVLFRDLLVLEQRQELSSCAYSKLKQIAPSLNLGVDGVPISIF